MIRSLGLCSVVALALGCGGSDRVIYVMQPPPQPTTASTVAVAPTPTATTAGDPGDDPTGASRSDDATSTRASSTRSRRW